MRLLALLLLAALLVSGCSQAPAPHAATATSTPSASPAGPGATGPAATHAFSPDLAAPSLRPDLDVGTGDGEPNIAIAPDGTIYLTPISSLYRSTDGGKSFTDLGTAKTDGHGDGDIAVDSSGRLHWLGLFGTGGAIPYQHSDDRGQTFTRSVDLSDPKLGKNGTGSDREWIDAAPDGWLYTNWRDGSGGGTITVRTSSDGGNTWNPLVTVGPDRLTGPIVHGPKPGTAYIPMTNSAGTGPSTPVTNPPLGNFSLELAVTHDHGATWTVKPVLTPEQPATTEPLVDEGTVIFPMLSVDDNGTLYYTWSSSLPTQGVDAPRTASRFGIHLVVSKDEGAHWSSPVVISDPAHAALMPFSVAGAGGRLAVVWYENTYGNPSDNVPDLWNVKLWMASDADAGAAHKQVVQLNAQPSHIGSVCTSGGACTFDAGDRSLLDYFEVALDGRGLPQVVWSSSDLGTPIGVAAQSTHVHFGGVADGTPLRAPTN